MDVAATHPRIFGVDFSGAVQAGKKIWLAGGRELDGRFVIEQSCRAADLPDEGKDQVAAYAGLTTFIMQQPDAIFGIDAPFGVPAVFMQGRTWEEYLGQFACRYPTAALFRAGCRIGADGKEARRVADRSPRTPFAPANLRLYRQTYHALAHVLAPLVHDDIARALPMQAPTPGKPLLVEICPALTVRALGRFGPYKGKTPTHREQRAAILARLVASGLAPLPDALAGAALADREGDALDSIIAAWTVWQLRPRLAERPTGDWSAYQREGYVYSLHPDEIAHQQAERTSP